MAFIKKAVKTVENVDSASFKLIEQKRFPVVLKGIPIGNCKAKWTAEYMATVVKNKEVTIHVSQQPQMNFIEKNFQYKKMDFGTFVTKASKTLQDGDFFMSKEEKYYLRSLGQDNRKDVADIRKDFPEIAADIKFPAFFEENQFFSSVFRIASEGLQLWTHYDIMDNMLIVVSGRKRVVLFSPQDALYLYLNGDKSEVMDIDNPDLERFPEFSKATRYECVLEAGDILFIPALWFHNVINECWGIAVNVFWRHLKAGQYDAKDVYGNKDLIPAQHAMQAMDRALKHLNTLPAEYKDFYARRMIQTLQQKAFIPDS